MSIEKRRLGATLAGGILLVAICLLLWRRGEKPVSVQTPSTSAAVRRQAEAPTLSHPTEMRGAFEKCAARLRTSTGQASAGHLLAELRRELAAAQKTEAVAAICAFLNARTNAATHQGFRLGSKGLLTEAPTLRVFLLDHLGQLDAAAAARYARTILSTPDSAEEWAIALRNVAREEASPEGRAFLMQKVGELLGYEPWRKDPSTGYLEAFDAAVYLGGTNLLPALSDLIRRQDNPAVAHAAYLALDRLVLSDPIALLGALGADTTLMQGREQTRANYFARADVRDPQQRQILENYLLNPQISSAELAKFAGIFPNANFMISQNLLTPTPTPDHAALVGRDVESLRVVQEWLGDSRFTDLRPQLETAKSRLEGFVHQANR